MSEDLTTVPEAFRKELEFLSGFTQDELLKKLKAHAREENILIPEAADSLLRELIYHSFRSGAHFVATAIAEESLRGYEQKIAEATISFTKLTKEELANAPIGPGN